MVFYDWDTITCNCTAFDGRKKTLYATEGEAKCQADKIMAKENVRLETYRCPHSDGWHLRRQRNL